MAFQVTGREFAIPFPEINRSFPERVAHTGDARRIASRVDHATVQFRLQASKNSRIVEPFFGAETGTVFGTVSLGEEGHFGLHGMRERAKLIRGKLSVWTAPASGTEIELSVPAVHAYAASSAPWRSWFTEKFSGSARRSGHEQPSQSDSDSVD